jgi:hypothetical protein
MCFGTLFKKPTLKTTAEKSETARTTGTTTENQLNQLTGATTGKQAITYDPTQMAYYNKILASLGDTLGGKLAKPGVPSDVETAWWRTGKERIGKTYGDLATEATQALAGRGVEGGGTANKVMSNIQTGKAGAMSELGREMTEKQYSDMWNTITAALGFPKPLQTGAETAATTEQTTQSQIQRLIDELTKGSSKITTKQPGESDAASLLGSVLGLFL